MDFITSLPPSQGHTVILMVVDTLLKSGHFIALSRNFTRQKVAEVIVQDFVRLYGFLTKSFAMQFSTLNFEWKLTNSRELIWPKVLLIIQKWMAKQIHWTNSLKCISVILLQIFLLHGYLFFSRQNFGTILNTKTAPSWLLLRQSMAGLLLPSLL